MTESEPARRAKNTSVEADVPLEGCASLEWLYAQSKAGRWGLSRDCFALTLKRSARKFLSTGAASQQRLEEYLGALHLEDLALASACAEGSEAAWGHFVGSYRSYLRAAAAAILRCSSGSAEAFELADSLFSELYGLSGRKDPQRSLFRYFHGRSSLKTWLRAVLAQRHIDSIRVRRRFEKLPEDDSRDVPGRAERVVQAPLGDPHRDRYLALFSRALEAALDQLEPREKQRLRLYYAEEKTLAEIGREFGEHESSVSRHLERVRRDLRKEVEETLRRGVVAANGSAAEPGLSEAEIALCLEYGAEDTSFDFEKLLPPQKSPGGPSGKRPAT